jgi:hypothetical protein
MKHIQLKFAAVFVTAILLPGIAAAQNRPRLHINPRWEQCSFQLDPSLTQSAWRQFTGEAGQVVAFRPLKGARPMGRGNFEFSVMQWQTNVDDSDAAWNDTFVHPDSTHWLYEGSGLKFPGLAFRAGVTSRSDVGLYYTTNPNANYGAYGVQFQQNLLHRDADELDISARVSYMALSGPDDLDLSVYGGDLVGSLRGLTVRRATITPYAGISAYLSSSHEKSSRVTLADERVLGVMATVGAELRFSMLRLGAEAGIGKVPSVAFKVGFGR